MAKTEAGYYLHIEPVEVAAITNREDFATAVRRTIERGHPLVPTPTRATGFPKPLVPKYARVKSLAAFEKSASLWSLQEVNERFQIEQWKKRPKGGWIPNSDRREILPPGISLQDAIGRLIGSIQSAL
jgi:hypothetical protein